MTEPVEEPVEDHPSDAELRTRTRELLAAAEQISSELILQTEKLNFAIDLFQREIIAPLRKGLTPDD